MVAPWSDTASLEAMQELCTAEVVGTIGGFLIGMHMDEDTQCSRAAWFDWCSLSVIDYDGRRYRTPAPAIWEPLFPEPGLAAVVPFQSTLCVTLEPLLTLPYARRGRIFLPTGNLGTISALDGTFPQEQGELIAARVAYTIAEIRDLVTWGPEEDPLISAQVCIVSPYGGGHWNPVAAVSIGQVIDTQRRRRAGLTEEPRTLVDIPHVPGA
jgi:hypothetical protein